VARAPRLGLGHEARALREGVAHGVRVAADHHHEPLRRERLGQPERIGEQRPARDLVQDLRTPRLHAGAVTGGEDHHGERRVLRHRCGAHRPPVSAIEPGRVVLEVSAETAHEGFIPAGHAWRGRVRAR
jgi:hypothetical protein